MSQQPNTTQTEESNNEQPESIHPEKVATWDGDSGRWESVTAVDNDFYENHLLKSDEGEWVVATQRQDGAVEVEGTENEPGLTLRPHSFKVQRYAQDFDDLGVVWDSELDLAEEHDASMEPLSVGESHFLDWMDGVQSCEVTADGMVLNETVTGVKFKVDFEGGDEK